MEQRLLNSPVAVADFVMYTVDAYAAGADFVTRSMSASADMYTSDALTGGSGRFSDVDSRRVRGGGGFCD
jgi:hypothetical protein